MDAFFVLNSCKIGDFGENNYLQNSQIFNVLARRSEYCRNDRFSPFLHFKIRD